MNEEETKGTLKTMKENIDKKYLKSRNSVAIETALNLLEKKDIDIIETKEANRQLSIELQKKDKIINLMAEEFENLKLAYFKKEDGGEFMGKYRTYNKNDWKQYFERKVENGN